MSVRDVLDTQRVILTKRWGYAAVCFLLYVAFVLALGMLSPSGSLFGNMFLFLGLIVAPGILPFTLLMIYLRLRRDHQRKAGVFAVTRSTLTNQGIEAELHGHSTTMPWSDFDSFLAAPRVVLLFLKGSSNHLIVSRSKLRNPDDWLLLLDFLHAHFPSD